MRDLEERPKSPTTAQAYVEFAPFVRRILLSYGVRQAELGDLCHEVFLVVHGRSDRLEEIERIDLWLREICRRVAAGYRRRAVHKREVLSAAPAYADPLAEAGAPDSSVDGDETEALRRALDRLDGESRDLLALHDVGDMPVTELAKLVERDRKTVRKRLELARRRLTALTREETAREIAMGSMGDRGTGAGPVARPTPLTPLSTELEVVAVTPGVNIGLIGNTVVATWPGLASVEALQTLLEMGQRHIERCGGKIAYLAVVEASVRPPPREGRDKIVESLDIMGPSVLGYATALLGGLAWIAQPIMSGLMLLARPRFPMRFFNGVTPAATWLCAHFAIGPDGPLDVEALCAAAEALRALHG